MKTSFREEEKREEKREGENSLRDKIVKRENKYNEKKDKNYPRLIRKKLKSH